MFYRAFSRGEWHLLMCVAAAITMLLAVLPTKRHLPLLYPLLTTAAGYGAANMWDASRFRSSRRTVILGRLLWQGDVIIPGPCPATRQIAEVYEETGSTIAVELVPIERTYLYGIIDEQPVEESRWGKKAGAAVRP